MTATKHYILLLFTITCVGLVFVLPPLPQDPRYHHFADQRTFFSIYNFLNVVTNLPLLLLGVIGLKVFFRKLSTWKLSSLPYLTLFIGVGGIGLGSAYYHYDPSNESLIWDRVPMTVTFMSYFIIVIAQYVNQRISNYLFFPLIVIGVSSVFFWYHSELIGEGDLRFYGLIQFYPMVAIPLVIFLYPTPVGMKVRISLIIFLYVIAKICEELDMAIFRLGQVISGHSLKHLFASAAVLFILLTLNPQNNTANNKD